jgi:hypothetical protein
MITSGYSYTRGVHIHANWRTVVNTVKYKPGFLGHLGYYHVHSGIQSIPTLHNRLQFPYIKLNFGQKIRNRTVKSVNAVHNLICCRCSRLLAYLSHIFKGHRKHKFRNTVLRHKLHHAFKMGSHCLYRPTDQSPNLLPINVS